jgi:hypothetical protein
MVRQLAGSTLSDDDVKELVSAALAEAGSNQGLSLQAFKAALKDQDLRGMVVEIPTEL